MNNFGRTPSNKSRLRLKAFFKRLIKTKVISSNLDCDVKPQPTHRLGASSSGGDGDFKGCFNYLIEEVKATGYSTGNYYKKTTGHIFNKPQLPGKLILINNKHFRIC